MTGARVPPARPPVPPDSLLDSIGITEAIARDDVEGLAALLRHADLGECAAVLDSLMARELCFAPLYAALAVLQDVGRELAQDASPGNAVITLARTLGLRWCDGCVQSGDFRQWALEQHRGH